jgi:DNA-binding NarL/FixJ family response regulator
MTIRVLIVDDHPIVVDGLVAGLRSHGIDVRDQRRPSAPHANSWHRTI